jgi:Holliday junction resolvase RusA-like endonuclease
VLVVCSELGADRGDSAMTLAFRVFGVAVPKGSMRAFVPKGWTRPIITDSNKNTNSWAQLVAEGASRALDQQQGAGVLIMDGVRLTLGFYLPRPKKYQKRGVEPAHLTKPDLDKLVRGVKDALTKVLWVDDSQVVEVIARKAYAPVDIAPHVDVRVETAFAAAADVPPATKGPAVMPLFGKEAGL